MKMKKLVLLVLLSMLTFQLSAQKDPFENFSFQNDTTKDRSSSAYYGYGTFLGENTYGLGNVSYADQFSMIGRTMFGEEEEATLKLGMSYYYDFSNYYVENNSFPLAFEDSTEPKRQKFSTQSIGVDLFARLDFNKYNEKSMFLDVGFYGSFNVVRKFKMIFERDSENFPFYEKQKLVHKKVSYLQKFNYGPVIRLGWSKFHFVVNYRLSDVFVDNFEDFTFVPFGEMPKIFVGINVGS